MNGWQRFGLLVLGCIAVMVLFPDFDGKGWSFILFTLLGGTAILLVLSVISGLFAIYRFETLNKLITIVFIVCVGYVLLWYFPQVNYPAPIYQLKEGKTPTKADIKRGIRRLTFNFDFVRRNVRLDENFSNQELNKEKKDKKHASSKSTQEQNEDKLDIVVE